MIKRIVTGAALIILSVTLILISKWAMALLIVPVGIAGIREFFRLAESKGLRPSLYNGVFSVSALYLSALLLPSDMIPAVLTALIIFTISVFVLKKDIASASFVDAGVTILGYVYIGWFFSMIFCVRDMSGTIISAGFTIDQGAAMVLLLVFANCFTDIGSYFFGKFFGRNKLCPHISPNKTVEGSIGGICTGICVSVLIGKLLSFNLMDSMWFGLIISIVAQGGDLWESLIKRDASVKDSGKSIPGHGGVLDRFDSLFLTTPVAFYLFKYFSIL